MCTMYGLTRVLVAAYEETGAVADNPIVDDDPDGVENAPAVYTFNALYEATGEEIVVHVSRCITYLDSSTSGYREILITDLIDELTALKSCQKRAVSGPGLN